MAIEPKIDLNRTTDKTEKEESTSSSMVDSAPNSKFKNIIITCLVCVAILVLIVVITKMFNKEEANVPASNEDGLTEVVSRAPVSEDRPWLNGTQPSQPLNNEGGEYNSTEVVKPNIGITDISEDTKWINDTKVVSDTFVKDLVGLDIEENYDIVEIITIVDFISYEKKRAVTDEGIELYWLEAMYKGKSAKVAVPFRIFKELDPVGVTVVDVEVVRAKGQDKLVHEIVTGFTVRTDYKKILEQNRGR